MSGPMASEGSDRVEDSIPGRVDTLRQQQDAFVNILHRLRNVADKMVLSEPNKDSPVENKESPPPVLTLVLNDMIRRNTELLDNLNLELSRIETGMAL